MNDTAKKIFGERSERYAKLDILSQERYYRPLFDLAAVQPGERVLDLATGTGMLAIMLSRIAASVVAADVTPEMLTIAEANIAEAGRGNITIVEADASELPFADGSFELVTCRLAFHHFPEPESALAELRRVLTGGGRLVLEDVFGPEDGAVSEARERFEMLLDPSHIRSYSPGELRKLIENAGFHVDELRLLPAEELTLDLLLDLERIDTPERRQAALKLLRENIGRDLGGVTPYEEEGQLKLSWQVLLLAATNGDGS